MKPLCLFFIAAVFLHISTETAGARLVKMWTYQELLDKSDLVVIAAPIRTDDTKERIDLPGFYHQPVIGVETKFGIHAVLKGEESLKELVLHHYRFNDQHYVVPNGPSLVSFTPVAEGAFTAQQKSFILFLVRESDGRYAPVVGQMDPGSYGIRRLGR